MLREGRRWGWVVVHEESRRQKGSTSKKLKITQGCAAVLKTISNSEVCILLCCRASAVVLNNADNSGL